MAQSVILLAKTWGLWRRYFLSIAFPSFAFSTIYLDYNRTQEYKKRKLVEATANSL